MPRSNPDANTDPGEHTGTMGSPPRMPRWVKVSLIVLASLMLLFLALKLAGVGGGMGGEHGPARHASGPATTAGVILQPAPSRVFPA